MTQKKNPNLTKRNSRRLGHQMFREICRELTDSCLAQVINSLPCNPFMTEQGWGVLVVSPHPCIAQTGFERDVEDILQKIDAEEGEVQNLSSISSFIC